MDTLYLAVMGAPLDHGLLAQFAARKEGMTKRRTEAVRVASSSAFADERSPVQIGDEEFVFGWGSRAFAYSLRNEDFLFLVAHVEKPKPTFPTMYVQVRAIALWAAGVEALSEVVERVRRLVAAMAPPKASQRVPALEQLLPSRLDLAVDVQGSSFTRDEVEAYVVTRAGWSADYNPEEHFDDLIEDWESKSESDEDGADELVGRTDYFGRGRRYTGSTFGRGQILMRLYNKTHQIKEKKIDWMRQVWAKCPAYDPKAEVWRVEAQLRREVLKELGFRTALDLLRPGMLAGAWAYMTGGPNERAKLGKNSGPWLSMRLSDDGNSTRRTVDPRWCVIASADFMQGPSTPAVREKSHNATAEQMAQMMTGCLSKFAAMIGAYCIDETGSLLPDLTWEAALDAVQRKMIVALANKHRPDARVDAFHGEAEVLEAALAEFAQRVEAKRAEHASLRRPLTQRSLPATSELETGDVRLDPQAGGT